MESNHHLVNQFSFLINSMVYNILEGKILILFIQKAMMKVADEQISDPKCI